MDISELRPPLDVGSGATIWGSHQEGRGEGGSDAGLLLGSLTGSIAETAPSEEPFGALRGAPLAAPPNFERNMLRPSARPASSCRLRIAISATISSKQLKGPQNAILARASRLATPAAWRGAEPLGAHQERETQQR